MSETVTRTLHWFFSLGTGGRDARYVLAGDLPDRLRPYFPGVRRSVLAPSGPYGEGSLRVARSVTGALLHLLGPPAKGVRVRFHLQPTTELFQPVERPKEGPSPFDALREDAPEWAQPFLDAGKLSLLDEQGEAKKEALLNSRDLDTVGRVVDNIVGDQIEDGDLVLLETTNGLRPFSIGALLAHSVLRATRPEVQVLAATYGELGGWNDAPGGAVSPIYDLSDFLELPLWASAAESLRRRFDVRPLSDLLPGEDPTLAKNLDQIAHALDLGWPSDLVEPLRSAATGIADLPAGKPGRSPVLKRLREGLDGLIQDVPEGAGPLDAARLRFHFTVAEHLADSDRFGDAIRVLREAMVDAALLAGSDGAPVADWRDHKKRAAADVRLFRADLPLFKRVGELRNAASHAKSSERHDEVGEAKNLVAALRGTDTQPGLVRQVRAEVFDGERFRVEFLPQDTPKPPFWFRADVDTHPRASDVARLIDAYREGQPLPLRLPAAKAAAPAGGPPAETLRIEPSKDPLRSGDWPRDKAKKARGARDAVLDLAEQPTDQSLLAAALRDIGIRPWALVGDALWPLFTRRDLGAP